MTEKIETVFRMKMAKADGRDMDAGYDLMSLLNDLDRDDYPELHDERKPDAPTYFDQDDREHLQHLHTLLKKIIEKSPGFMGRIMGGMSCFLNPKNALIDQEADTIEFHPGLRRNVQWQPFDPATLSDGAWWVWNGSGIAEFAWREGAWHHPPSRAQFANGPVGVDLGVLMVHPFFGPPDPPEPIASPLAKGVIAF